MSLLILILTFLSIIGSRKDDSKPATTDIKLKKIMLTRPTLATTLATTASKLGSTDPEALELAAEAEVRIGVGMIALYGQ